MLKNENIVIHPQLILNKKKSQKKGLQEAVKSILFEKIKVNKKVFSKR